MKKQNLILMIIISFALTVSVGYAAFSESIDTKGTATAKGSFDLEFTSAVVSQEVGSVGSLVEISSDKNTLTLTVPKLEYPGAYALFNVTVTNKGTIPAILKSIEKTNLTEDNNVKISYVGLDEVIGMQINQNATQEFTVKVMWDVNSTAASSNVEFSLKLNYQQIIP